MPRTRTWTPLVVALLTPAVMQLVSCGEDPAPLDAAPAADLARPAADQAGGPDLRDPALDMDRDCPPELACEDIPAAYEVTDPMTGSYGNYDLADRERDQLDIRYIVIHDTETPYDGTIKIFQNPKAKASAHFLIRSSDGHVARMIDTRNVAWHAGNWHYNSHSIGIEHEGVAVEGGMWYTEAMYRASATLVRHLARRYNIPLDRAHIIGHDEVPGTRPTSQAGMHWDPGPFWDWDHYMALLNAPITAAGSGEVVTIRPSFKENPEKVSYCYKNGTDDCRDVVGPGANFVYLRTMPDPAAPLITNPYIGSPPTRIFNWSNRAATGQRYALAERKGDWAAIYFSGTKAWFQDPSRMNTVPARATVITPRGGATIPVFGIGYPGSAEAYPPPTTQPIMEKVYDLPAGQSYVAAGPYPAAYYYAREYAPKLEQASHKVVLGKDAYYEISFNHRMGLVRKDDVDAAER